ncbi:transglycosylase family protein [Streptomyces sparsus]
MAGRGRHRRYKPSTVSRASLTVTAGGAGLALPLVGISHAQAAPVDTWDKVAACESSNNWDINTGNGYFGGLQFKQSTWQAFGGTAFAARADLASKEQQISVAERVLKGQGPGAWPNCSVKAGLTRDMAQPRAARSTTERPAVPSVAPAAGKKATAASSRVTPPSQEDKRGSTAYEVAGGDTLSGIASEQRVGGGWQALYERNRQTIGEDPDLIIPGQRLRLTGSTPGTEKPTTPPPPKAEKPAPAPPKKAPAPPEKAQTPPKKEQAKPAPKPAERQASATSRAAKSTSRAYTAPVSGVSPGTSYRASGASWAAGYHTGVDFPVATGTSVKAVTSARVVSAGWAGSYGYQVVLRHDDGRYSQYAHLSAISVKPGQRVGSGQTIGRSGSTGNSTGPHLHFEIRSGPGYGSDMNPLAYLRQNGVSI